MQNMTYKNGCSTSKNDISVMHKLNTQASYDMIQWMTTNIQIEEDIIVQEMTGKLDLLT